MRIISYRIVTNHLIYTPIENMSVVWERHGLLDIATVTKEHGFLRRINCNSVAEKWSWSTKFWLFGVRNLDCWCHRSSDVGPLNPKLHVSSLFLSHSELSVCHFRNAEGNDWLAASCRLIASCFKIPQPYSLNYTLRCLSLKPVYLAGNWPVIDDYAQALSRSEHDFTLAWSLLSPCYSTWLCSNGSCSFRH